MAVQFSSDAYGILAQLVEHRASDAIVESSSISCSLRWCISIGRFPVLYSGCWGFESPLQLSFINLRGSYVLSPIRTHPNYTGRKSSTNCCVHSFKARYRRQINSGLWKQTMEWLGGWICIIEWDIRWYCYQNPENVARRMEQQHLIFKSA